MLPLSLTGYPYDFQKIRYLQSQRAKPLTALLRSVAVAIS